MTKYTQAQKRAIMKYRSEVQRIEISVPIERKAAYQEAAAAAGKSLNRFIIDCIEASLKVSDSSPEGK